MECLVLAVFSAVLLTCLAFDLSILYALLFGLLLFLLYGRIRGYAWRELVGMAIDGVKAVKNILITFLLIGAMTALWRAAGTIPLIVCHASSMIRPSVFLLATFLLNCGVSVLTGTSFGTGATVGVICAAMASSMGIDLRLVGGAVLSGIYFGDRCSPVSTSALLVAELTGTNIYGNIKRMLRSALAPFLLTCVVYGLLGLSLSGSGKMPELRALFGREFALHWLALIPALVILLLSALRVDVKLSMTASILAAMPLCLALQHDTPLNLLREVVLGFHATNPEIAAVTDGGGIVSMLKVAGIVCLSSSYSGIFQKTGLLNGAKRGIELFGKKTTPFAAVLCTSVAAAMVACNQTLTIMLTGQLCSGVVKNSTELANDLEDTAVVVAPLIPWSIACGVPLAAVGASSSAICFACYLYLLPAWRVGSSFLNKRRKSRAKRPDNI